MTDSYLFAIWAWISQISYFWKVFLEIFSSTVLAGCIYFQSIVEKDLGKLWVDNLNRMAHLGYLWLDGRIFEMWQLRYLKEMSRSHIFWGHSWKFVRDLLLDCGSLFSSFELSSSRQEKLSYSSNLFVRARVVGWPVLLVDELQHFY